MGSRTSAPQRSSPAPLQLTPQVPRSAPPLNTSFHPLSHFQPKRTELLGVGSPLLSLSFKKAVSRTRHETPRFRRILAPTDFSDEATAGTNYAIHLARKLGATLLLVHVIEPLPAFEGMETLPVLRTPSELAKLARSRLKKIADAETRDGPRLSTSVVTGKPFKAITTTASEQSSDLIVLATLGRTGLHRALIGSTAERIVRHAPCSVLTVSARAPIRGAKRKSFRIGKILVPLDFSDRSITALPWAAFLAESFGAEILLFNVTEIFPIDYIVGRQMMNHAITPLMHDARAALERISDDLSAVTDAKISASVIQGVPHKEICHAARKKRADLIVITTRGHTGLKHLWLGSTAERVVRHARCPVLVVRQPKKLRTNVSAMQPFSSTRKPERAARSR
jgi:nucleotide-binding universal stress UspA family protein